MKKVNDLSNSNISDYSLSKSIRNNLKSSTLMMSNQKLELIKSFNPKFDSYQLTNLNLDLYLTLSNSLIIDKLWFLDKKMIESIDGIRHLQRTSFYAFLLAKQLRLNNKQILSTVIAALLHGIRNQAEEYQIGCTCQVQKWFEENKALISSEWGLSFRESYFNSISASIGLLDIPYNKFTSEHNVIYRKYSKLVDVLKTSEALDNYRLPNPQRWIKNNQLNLIPRDSIKQMAYDMVVLSESYKLHGYSSVDSVKKAIDLMNTDFSSFEDRWSNVYSTNEMVSGSI